MSIASPEPITAAELRAWRTHWLLDQGRLAHMLGVHIGTVNRWERGVGPIPPYLRLALEPLERQLAAQLIERARGPARNSAEEATTT
jgi:predicted transcriptional regulator